MSVLRDWVAVEAGTVVHGDFRATVEYINTYEEDIVNSDNVTTPPWYNNKVTFLDVTEMKPKPSIGWYLEGNTWKNGNPVFEQDRNVIPPDGTTAATIRVTPSTKDAPSSVTFLVNGKEVIDPVTNGSATVEIVSTNRGDTIEVQVYGRIFIVQVED